MAAKKKAEKPAAVKRENYEPEPVGTMNPEPNAGRPPGLQAGTGPGQIKI